MKPARLSLSVHFYSKRICVGLLLALILGPGLGSAEPAGPLADESLWITLEVDSFESLAGLEGSSFELEALERVGEASGVVLTRVQAADLPLISTWTHQTQQRCAGFVAHGSLAEGREELERLRVDRPSRAPSGGYTIDQTVLVNRLEAAIDKPEMLDTLDHLSNDFNNRYHANPAGTAAALWIRDQWLAIAAGREDVTVELFNHVQTNQPSVILTIDGADLPDEIVVLGGHLDSITGDPDPGDPDYLAPGADDDASGITVLNEVIRVALAEDFQPKRTVQFIGYAAEEAGLVGSGEIADAYQAAGIDVVAVLQLDMTDWFGSVEDIGVLNEQWTDPVLTGFVTELIDVYQPDLLWTFTGCGYPCSDHYSWDSAGYPAAMPFESKFGEHNPNIHSPDDTLATLGNSVDHAYKFARLATAFMVEIAKGVDEIFADGFESGDTSAWSTVVP